MTNLFRVDHKVEFARNWRDDICIGYMQITTMEPTTEAQALKAVKAALTQWIATTEDGRKAYGDYEEFNFGDFLNSEPWEDASFTEIAKKHGLISVTGDSYGSVDSAEDWDARLVDHDEIKDSWEKRGIEE